MKTSAAEATNQSATMMKALFPEGSGSAQLLRVREVKVPDVPDDGVLVHVRAASVNAGDWHRVHGGRTVRVIGWALRSPFHPISGADLAGVVQRVGRYATRFHTGNEVFGAGAGSFAEYALAREDRLALKPQQLSFEEAAATPIAGVTALQGLRDVGHLQRGQRVLVYGAGGGVGTFAVMIAKALGAEVTAVTSTQNLEIVESLGPAEVVDYTREDVTRRAQRYQVVFDVAATRPLAELTRLLEPGGTLVLAGAAKGGVLAIARRLLEAQARSRLRGQHVHSFLARVTRKDLEVLAELAGAGKLRPAIDRRYLLAEAAEAVHYVGTGRARAKVVIEVG